MDDLERSCVDIIKSWIRADYDASIKSKSICYTSAEDVLSSASKIENGHEKIDENSVAECIGLNESQRDCAVEDLLSDMIATNKSYGVKDEPERLLQHPCPAPPPTLYAGTRWRLHAERKYRRSSVNNI